MILLGLDVETSGLDPANDRIIEMGAVLFDWDTKMPMQILSELVDPTMDMTTNSDQFTLPAEITAITGITSEALDNYGTHERDTLAKLDEMAFHTGYFVAHNGNAFDRPFVEEAFRRHSIELSDKPWLDTMVDIKFPASIKTRNMHHLGADHMVLNPFRHRAVFDVLTMFKVMEHYNLDDIIVRSKEPMVYLQALVSFDEKEKAKERGYRWYAPAKIWWKGMKQTDADIEVAECSFQTRRLERAPE